ncbi:MAG TPA: alpha-(1-_3)-arabinofuranosyltransferase family protein [Acidimicrobiales bacterium]
MAPAVAGPRGCGAVHDRATGRLRPLLEYSILAVLAFVPMLASQPGKVTDDTKTYLYLDPARYIRQAVSLWDPNVALGTVTHENIGYLFPMGPFFWVCAELHLPVWVAQRLWLGTLIFAAGAGVLYLCRTINLNGPGRYVAALAFMFTPYVLQYSGRISVILMPWSALPWMLAFVVLALRRPGWRYPALFALAVALVSGINASSILYVGIGPALWLPFAVLVLREATWRRAWGVAWRIVVLVVLTSLWWVVGLQVEAAYGINILKYTETLSSTSSASSPFESLRGLGYWFFYGRSDQTGNWTQAAVSYTQVLWLIGITFLVPAMAFAAATVLRWRQRSFFILLLVLGMVLAVGPYPYFTPTGIGSLFKAFMSETTAGLALRSTDRAVPLVLLALAVLLGAGVTAVAGRYPRGGLLVAGMAVIGVAVAWSPGWTGDTVVHGLTQPARPPAYVVQAADALNATHPGTRVFAVPGDNFAAYRWGDTIDTVWPALLTRPFVTHEQQTMGSLPTADILEAVDTPLQEGVLDPRALAPMSSLMSAGDVLVQYDQQFERYNVPDPRVVARSFHPTPHGLSNPVPYGSPRQNVSSVPNLNEQTLSLPSPTAPLAPVVTYTVAAPRPVVRAESTAAPLVVSGNGSGLVAASAAGLLAGDPTIFYTGTLDPKPVQLHHVLGAKPSLVVTDTNPKQGYRWNGITENAGFIETATSPADAYNDPLNAPLNLFPDAPANAFSTTVFDGVNSITASSFGSPVQYFNDQRPAAAMDGSTSTAWVLSQAPPIGQWWEVQLNHPTTVDSINLSQLVTNRPTQVLTHLTLTFDYGRPVEVDLTHASQTAAGQTIHFSPRTFSLLRITLNASRGTPYQVPAGYQNVTGLSEVRIPGVRTSELVSMPEDLLRAAGTSSQSDPLSLLMTRLRGSGFPPRGDYQASLARRFWLPTARTFALAGQARVSAQASDQLVAATVGEGSSGATPVIAAASSSRLTGDIAAGARAAVDGNAATAWQSALSPTNQDGQWLQYTLAAPLTFDSLDLAVVADGRHSVPTALTVSAGGRSERVALPAVHDGAPGTVVRVPVTLPTPMTGSVVRVTVDSSRPEYTTNYTTQARQALPLGIAELGILGLAVTPPPAELSGTCRSDLLTVDGMPVWVSVTGSTVSALTRDPLTVSLCGPDAAGLALSAGSHTVLSAPGQTAGFDIDQLALASAPGGGAAALLPGGQLPAPATATVGAVRVISQTATRMSLAISGIRSTTAPFELVLGQSINPGWTAQAGGRQLSNPVLVDGFANGWRVDPAAVAGGIHDGTLSVTLVWVPQRSVNVALVVSAMGLVLCLMLVLLPLRRNRRRQVADGAEADGSHASDGGPGPVLVATWAGEGTSTGWVATVAAGAACGLAAAYIAAPLVGGLVGAGVVVVLRVPRLRLLLGAVATVLVLATGTFVVIRQGVVPTRANGGWPSQFGGADGLAWAGVLFLGADAVVELVTRRRSSVPHGPDPVAGPDLEPEGAAVVPSGDDGGHDEGAN